jgi:hypothetical protein
MKVFVSGAGGLVGSALVDALRGDGHDVGRLVRRRGEEVAGAVFWDPDAGVVDGEGLAGAEAVVHLAGEPIAAGRWNAERKARIRDSRTRGTRLLAAAAAALDPPPRVLVSASAVGYYGDRGDEVLTEDAGPGDGFLSEVCVRWEEAADAARERGIRVVHPRIGMVLSPRGGALAKMLVPFRLGLGGVVGGGRQWVSWIALDDLVSALCHALGDEGLAGPVNAVAPAPVTQRELTRTLSRVLKRPAALPLPAFAVRLLLGEMADELLLASARADAARLSAAGFRFRYPDLGATLAALLAP